mmetsp:Transcript_98697/g.318274  ORF Transcript_98697/g.318274 Transcript_98697/m.318274 type:complete len:291 (-) Transcript_98697:253-1125(-)
MPFAMAACQAAGAESSPPGRSRASGNTIAVATMVSTASWLVLRSIISVPMSPVLPNLVASTLRVTKAKFEAMAVAKPNIVKESSEEEARATPANTGNRDAYTMGWNTCPKIRAEAMALTAGSKAFTTCVKDTATAPREATVSTWPAAKAAPTGASLRMSAVVTFGLTTNPVAHMSMEMGMPAASCMKETAQVASKAFISILFWMLYWTLKKYQQPTKMGSLSLSNKPPVFSSAFGEDCTAAADAARAVAAKTKGHEASWFSGSRSAFWAIGMFHAWLAEAPAKAEGWSGR